MCSSVVPGSCAVYGRHGLPGLTLTFCHAAERLVAVIAEGPAPRSATAARHTGASAQRLEPVLLQERPDLVVVVSHVNSIVAARVHFVGNTMSDTQERLLPQARGGEGERCSSTCASGCKVTASAPGAPSLIHVLARSYSEVVFWQFRSSAFVRTRPDADFIWRCP